MDYSPKPSCSHHSIAKDFFPTARMAGRDNWRDMITHTIDPPPPESTTIYQEQCSSWFKRETRSKRSNLMDHDVLKSLKRIKRIKLKDHNNGSQPGSSQFSESASEQNEVSFGGEAEILMAMCVACDPMENSELTSRTYMKRLSNNTSICAVDRFLTEALLNIQLDPAKSIQDNCSDIVVDKRLIREGNELGFAVNEDRRIRSGVKRHGTDAWSTILNENRRLFAPDRTPQDLEVRWKFICDNHS